MTWGAVRVEVVELSMALACDVVGGGALLFFTRDLATFLGTNGNAVEAIARKRGDNAGGRVERGGVQERQAMSHSGQEGWTMF